MLGEVSNAVMQVFARSSGKGPREAKSYLNDQVLVTVLKGELTSLEETLLAGGREDVVRDVRMSLESEIARDLVSIVEQVTRRAVLDYQSQVLLKARYMIEIFVLGDEIDPS